MFRKLGPLIAKVNHLVTAGHSLDLSAAEKNEVRAMKNEIEEWQKKLNKINSEFNELSARNAGGGVRTHGGLIHQVLSLTPLATREPPPRRNTIPNPIKTYSDNLSQQCI